MERNSIKTPLEENFLACNKQKRLIHSPVRSEDFFLILMKLFKKNQQNDIYLWCDLRQINLFFLLNGDVFGD